jgi:hypothetical protein
MLRAPLAAKALLCTLVFCFSGRSADQKDSSSQPCVSRAAVSLTEDFQAGLKNWKTAGGSSAGWSIDKLGMVAPSRLALYEPSHKLTDYELRFQGTIDAGGLSWVVRASDSRNYYAVKLVVIPARPLRKLVIRRYAVVNAVPMKRVETPLALDERTDSLYRVSLNIQGDRYVLTVQDQLADSWTERRLKVGGVGFFADPGERSRISGLQITHQDDWLGRFCAQVSR